MKNFKQYITQSWQIIKQNKLYSFFYILGTALAISMVMVIAIGYNLKVGNVYPEVNRDRTLILPWLQEELENCGGLRHHSYTENSIKKLTTGVKSVEAVCIQSMGATSKIQKDITSEQKEQFVAYYNEDVWKIYQFDFIDGEHFIKEDVENAIPKVVISASIAKTFFGKEKVAGEKIWIDNKKFTICGVVKDGTYFRTDSYAGIYAPLTLRKNYTKTSIRISSHVKILARSANDFDMIREQLENNLARYNNSIGHIKLRFDGKIESEIESELSISSSGFVDSDYSSSKHILQLLLVILVIIMVPALNLSGIISSEMKERESEVGIKKAFGASRSSLLYRLLNENLFLTLIGGFIGILLSYLYIYIGFQLFLTSFGIASYRISYSTLSMDMLINFKIIIIVLLSCTIINLLSSIIPLYISTRKSIISLLSRDQNIKDNRYTKGKSMWVIFELIAVFVITWMIVDPLYVLNYQKNMDNGFEHKHLYSLRIGQINELSPLYKEESEEDIIKNNRVLLGLIKNHPFVGKATVTDGRPMSRGRRYSEISRGENDSLSMDDVTVLPFSFDKEMFTLFGINTQDHNLENLNFNTVFISTSIAKKFFKDEQVIGKKILERNRELIIAGTINDIKIHEYEQPYPTIICFEDLSNDDYYGKDHLSITIKSKTSISEEEFIKTFTEDLEGKIKNASRYFYLSSFKKVINWENNNTITQNNIYTIIACFVLINMFLGIFATFWLQSKKRRGEIGLRMAMGSSKKKVSRMFVMESVKMATLAALVGLIVVGNIVYFKGMFTYGEFQNPVYWAVTNDTAHFIIVSLIAYAVILITVTLGTLIPASKAANTNPVDALRDE